MMDGEISGPRVRELAKMRTGQATGMLSSNNMVAFKNYYYYTNIDDWRHHRNSVCHTQMNLKNLWQHAQGLYRFKLDRLAKESSVSLTML